MTTLYFLLCLTIIPFDDVVVERVDYIEINHVYLADNGELNGTYINFWRNSPYKEWKYKDCVGWKSIPKSAFTNYTEKEMGQKREEFRAAGVKTPDNLKKWAGLDITYDHSNRLYSYVFWDGKFLRKVVSPSFSRTWTMYDSEAQHRILQSKELRAGFFKF
jgi:hypothetical protein